MTVQDFIDRSAGTFLVIKINDGLWVDCYKTCNLTINNNVDNIGAPVLEIHEGENHNAFLYAIDMAVEDLCMRHIEYDDGHIEQYYIYDASRSESMKAAIEKLNDIMAKLSNMRDRIDGFRNSVIYDMLNLIRSEKENKQ